MFGRIFMFAICIWCKDLFFGYFPKVKDKRSQLLKASLPGQFCRQLNYRLVCFSHSIDIRSKRRKIQIATFIEWWWMVSCWSSNYHQRHMIITRTRKSFFSMIVFAWRLNFLLLKWRNDKWMVIIREALVW